MIGRAGKTWISRGSDDTGISSVLGSESYSFTIKGGQVPVLPVRSALVHPGSVLSAVANDVEWVP